MTIESPQIESATTVTVATRMFGLGLDSWNTLTIIFLGLAAIAAIAVVVAQFAIIKLQKAEVLAAKEEFEKYKVGVGLEIAEANKVAGIANERTEELRKANLELEAQIAPRRLTKEQIHQIVSTLKNFAGKTVKVVSYPSDAEAAILAGQIIECLKAAGITPINAILAELTLGFVQMGIRVDGPNDDLAQALRTGLGEKGGLVVAPPPPAKGTVIVTPPQMSSTPPRLGGPVETAPDATVEVGVKPLIAVQ